MLSPPEWKCSTLRMVSINKHCKSYLEVSYEHRIH